MEIQLNVLRKDVGISSFLTHPILGDLHRSSDTRGELSKCKEKVFKTYMLLSKEVYKETAKDTTKHADSTKSKLLPFDHL